MNAEQVLFQVVTCSERLWADVALMISLIKVNTEDVSGDTAFVSERPVAPVAHEFIVLVSPPYVGLKSIGLVKWSATKTATKPGIYGDKI